MEVLSPLLAWLWVALFEASEHQLPAGPRAQGVLSQAGHVSPELRWATKRMRSQQVTSYKGLAQHGGSGALADAVPGAVTCLWH